MASLPNITPPPLNQPLLSTPPRSPPPFDASFHPVAPSCWALCKVFTSHVAFVVQLAYFLVKRRVPRVLSVADVACILTQTLLMHASATHYHRHFSTVAIDIGNACVRCLVVNAVFSQRARPSLLPDIVVVSLLLCTCVIALANEGQVLTSCVFAVLEGLATFFSAERRRQREAWRHNASFRIRFPFRRLYVRTNRASPTPDLASPMPFDSKTVVAAKNVTIEDPLLLPLEPRRPPGRFTKNVNTDAHPTSYLSSYSASSPSPAHALGSPGRDGGCGEGSQFLRLSDGMTVYFKELEAPDPQEPHCNILLLHQFGSGVFTWDHSLLPELHAAGHALTAFDRPGHGYTTYSPAESPCPPTVWVPWEIANAGYTEGGGSRVSTESLPGDHAPVPFHPFSSALSLQLSRYFLLKKESEAPRVAIGCGAGTALALCLVRHCHGLVLISPSIYNEGLPTFISSMMNTRVGRALSLSMLKAELGDFYLKKSWANPQAIPPHLWDKYHWPMKRPGWHEAILNLHKHYTPLHPHLGLTQALLRSPNGSCPILLVEGENDRVRGQERETSLLLAQLASHAPSTRVRLFKIPNCGRVPQEEAPHSLLKRALLPFLSALAKGDFSGGEGFASAEETVRKLKKKAAHSKAVSIV